MDFLEHYEGFGVTVDKIFIGNTKKGFYFDVYGPLGDKLYELNLPYERRKVNEVDKKRLIEERKEYLNYDHDL